MDESPFSNLAAETRNQIYELVLWPPGGIQIGIVGDTTAAATARLVHPPPQQKICSLLATCKATRKECRSMLYGANVFSIEEPSLPTDIFQEDEAKIVHEERYAECLRKLRVVLPLIQTVWIDAGTWRWNLNGGGRSAACKSLAERCHALREAIMMVPTMTHVDVQGLVRISANEPYLPRESPREDAAAAGCGHTSAWHANSVAFLFDLRDLSTLSAAAIQQTFRAENQRLRRLRVKDMMTLHQYSMEIMWLQRYRQRISPMLAEVVAMELEYRAQAPKPMDWFGREPTSTGMMDDVAAAAGDTFLLMARLEGVNMT